MSERFMVRCTLADLERYRAEAARRGLSRGRDSGVGALARIALNALVETGSIERGDPTVFGIALHRAVKP